MQIPTPCKFGEKAECNGKQRIFSGVTWFLWSSGWEWTYFFNTDDFWHSVDILSSRALEQPHYYTIDGSYLEDKTIKEHGYPLRGTGKMSGITLRNGLLYADFIMTSNYMTHIKIQCNEKGEYIENGDIIFPPSWDTEEKRENAKLKQYRFIENRKTEVVEQNYNQLTIFNYMRWQSI